MQDGVCYSDDEIEVLFRKGDPAYLVVTFAPMSRYADGAWYWGKSLADRVDLSVVAFVSRKPNWYPTANVLNALPAVNPILRSYGKIITYGASMGAYAALKMSRALGASTALAFSPQFSIDPAITGKDYNFARFYTPARDVDVTIRGFHVAPEAYIFYDPFYTDDATQIGHITRVAPWVSPVPVPSTAHETIRLFLRGTLGKTLLDTVASGDRQALRRLTSQLRRASPTRTATLLGRVVGRRPDLARRIFDKHCGVLGEPEADRIFSSYFRRLIDLARYGDAEAVLAWGQGINATDPNLMLRMAELRRLQGRPHEPADLQREIAEASGTTGTAADPSSTDGPPNRPPLEIEAEQVLARDDRDEILAFARASGSALVTALLLRAHALADRDVGLLRALAFLECRRGQPHVGVKWAEQAVDVSDNDPFARDTLANALLQAGRLAEARRAIEQALLVLPDNARMLQTLASIEAALSPSPA